MRPRTPVTDLWAIDFIARQLLMGALPWQKALLFNMLSEPEIYKFGMDELMRQHSCYDDHFDVRTCDAFEKNFNDSI